MIISSDSLSRGSGTPYQVHNALLHAMSGTKLSRVRTELRLLPPEPINQSLLASRGADIVMAQQGYLSFQWVKVPSAEPSRNCRSHIQRREGRPTRRKPGSKSLGGQEILVRSAQEASNLTGRSKGEPGSPEMSALREADCRKVGRAESLIT